MRIEQRAIGWAGAAGGDRGRQGRTLAAVVVTALVTIVLGWVLVETAYLPLRERLKRAIGPTNPASTPRVDLRRTEAQAVQARRTAEILQERDLKYSIEQQTELMRLWHDLDIWQNMWFLGIRIQKNPCDLWMMQQILFEVQPDLVVEAGTGYGGSALYWAHVLDGLGLENSRVITIDIADRCEDARKLPLWKQYVEFILSSSTDPGTIARVRERAQGKKVLVCLDSWHADHHVLAELQAYGPMVSPGSYMVVEDTNMDFLGMQPDGAEAGPGRAVEVYLNEHGGKDLFTVDLGREQMVLTFNPGGWLRRRDDR